MRAEANVSAAGRRRGDGTTLLSHCLGIVSAVLLSVSLREAIGVVSIVVQKFRESKVAVVGRAERVSKVNDSLLRARKYREGRTGLKGWLEGRNG